ncbi:tetratricopeptide repeat-containing sensor histidine kinase [Pontibacter pamirensis]|uniref:tetratricopeptide repeat-containing sensor histidine kinase n=1 Tax=Pontibacter pamirensis TaxID=2562824 RepID=UPI0013897E44|nr:tetratricopeptide repeat protein [Pontibacter pamirensis]
MSATNEKIQLLEEQLRGSGDTVSRVDLLNRLAYELRHIDTSLSLHRSKEAIVLAEEASYKKGLAEAYLNQGFVEMVLANYSVALQIISKASSIFDDLKDKQGLGRSLYNLGTIFRSIGDYNQALESFQQSLRLRQSVGDKEGEARCFMQLGYISIQFGNYNEATTYYYRSLVISRQLNDLEGIAAVLGGIAIIEHKLQQYEQAEAHFLESLAIRKEIGEVHGWLVSMNYLGDLYFAMNRFSEAEIILSEALVQAKQHSNPFPANYCRLCTSMAKVYMASERFAEAIDYLEQSLSTAKDANLKYLIHDIYFALSEVYKRTGDYVQALSCYEQFHRYKEEVINLSASAKLKNLELSSQIEAEKKAAEIHRLRHIELKKTYDRLRETQQQLIQSEKMASLGELTAGVAHEIQNPLNFVNNFSEVSIELIEELREERRKEVRDAGLEAEIIMILEQNLAKIHYHGKRADSIVKDMLEHSRASGGEKQLVDLNALADEYLRLSYHGFRAKDKNFAAKLITQFDTHLGNVKVVPQDIGRVLLNLYNNAFYATQKKLRKVDNDYQPELKVSTHHQEDKFEIKIRDNGIGIPNKIKHKIFQPFFTTKPTGQGTGLGLSISYDIITKGHGGELTVASEEGEFTEFTLLLPLM